MSALLLIWLILASLLEKAIVVAPLDIKKPTKKVLYYILLAPALALNWAQDQAAKTSVAASLTAWFKKTF